MKTNGRPGPLHLLVIATLASVLLAPVVSRAEDFYGSFVTLNRKVLQGLNIRDLNDLSSDMIFTDGGDVCCGANLAAVFDNSALAVRGGLIGGELWGYHNSWIVINGGVISDSLWLYDQAEMDVERGAFIGMGAYARYDSTLRIKGGTLLGPVRSHENASVIVSGGTILDAAAFHRSSFTLRGGSVLTGRLDVFGTSTMEIVGDQFEVDGSPVSPGALTMQSGKLKGMLASGSWIERDFAHNGFDDTRNGIISLSQETPTLFAYTEDEHAIGDANLHKNEALDISGTADFSLTPGGRTVGAYTSGGGFFNLRGGAVESSLVSRESTQMLIESGSVGGELFAKDSSTIRVEGATILGALNAQDSATIEVVGNDFKIAGVPLPVSSFAQKSGVLTATLESGELLNNEFFHKGFDSDATGEIQLVFGGDATVAFNGGAPVTINDATYAGKSVLTQTTGDFLLAHPGAIELLYVDANSRASMTGGTINKSVVASGAAVVDITKGTIKRHLAAYGDSNIVMSGGTVQGKVYAQENATIEMVGVDFALNTVPVSLGLLPITSGTLTVAFATGGSVNSFFQHGGYDALSTGSLILKLDESASTSFDDGGAHEIDHAAMAAEQVQVAGATTLALKEGGATHDLFVQDSGHLDLQGGTVNEDLVLGENATAALSSGKVEGSLAMYGDSRLEYRGGDVDGNLYVRGGAEITIYGRNFQVTPQGAGQRPAPFGVLAAMNGQLKATLQSGESLRIDFWRNGGGAPGTIILPEPGSPILAYAAVAGVVWLRRRLRRQLRLG